MKPSASTTLRHLLATATLGLCACMPATAASVHALDLKPYCEPDAYFQVDSTGRACMAKTEAISAITHEASCAGPSLAWTSATPPATGGTCAAVADKLPKPICNPKVPNLEFKDGKCMLSTTPEQDKAEEFFKDWVVGIAIIQPSIPTVREASIIGGKVRVSHLVRNESALLVARQFYPWNPGKRCRGLVSDGWQNCFGLTVAAASPTTGGSNGQLVNFLGAGLAIGGSVNGLSNSSFGLGIGIGRKFNTRVLGEGWVDGQDPPAGETQVRYRDIDVEAKFIYFAVRW